MNGLITDITRGSFHDGPGIRTVVFLQGCSLQCRWCHNPETWSMTPMPLFYPDRCMGCGLCGGDPQNAGLCRYGAREFSSSEMSVEEVMEIILKDRDFYKNGGGVTFSGGEPCCQLEFLIEMLEQCRDEGVSAAMETNLNYPPEILEKVLPHLDLLMVDLKIVDRESHRAYTGVSNESILDNFTLLQGREIPLIVRTPLVRGVNDDDSNIEQSVALLKELSSLKYYELLRYHPLGTEKFKGLGRNLPEFEAPSEQRLTAVCDIIKRAGIRLLVDGREVGCRNHKEHSAGVRKFERPTANIERPTSNER